MTGTQSPATNSMTDRANQKKASRSDARTQRPVPNGPRELDTTTLDATTLAHLRKEVLHIARGAIAVFLLLGIASVFAAPYSFALYVIGLAIAARTIYRVMTRSPNLRQQLRDQMARNAERNRRL